ncbi:MAG: hypothetical protein KAS54_06830 [Dehalococcoidia bacterium]|nr:hypothetical protein [Dehalococcoidia bacterium]
MKLVQQLFVTLLVTYLLLLLVETIWEKSVSAYLNLNYWLIVLIVVGVVAVLTGPERREEEGRRLGRRDIAIVICAGLTGAAIVWYKTKEIGWLSYVISVISGGLIVLLFMLVWREEGEGEG